MCNTDIVLILLIYFTSSIVHIIAIDKSESRLFPISTSRKEGLWNQGHLLCSRHDGKVWK